MRVGVSVAVGSSVGEREAAAGNGERRLVVVEAGECVLAAVADA